MPAVVSPTLNEWVVTGGGFRVYQVRVVLPCERFGLGKDFSCALHAEFSTRLDDAALVDEVLQVKFSCYAEVGDFVRLVVGIVCVQAPIFLQRSIFVRCPDNQIFQSLEQFFQGPCRHDALHDEVPNELPHLCAFPEPVQVSVRHDVAARVDSDDRSDNVGLRFFHRLCNRLAD